MGSGMTDRKEVMAERLREARIKAGYASAGAAAAAFGFGGSTLTSHENGTRTFDVETAVRYGKAFKINPGLLLGLDAIDVPAFRIDRAPPSKKITIIGAVEAGVWRERTEWPESERYDIEVGYSIVPNAERFGLVVEGYSMDKVFPPGSELECIRVYRGSQEPQDGDLVVVERRQHDLRETTCKRLRKRDDKWELHCESTKPEFQTPIPLGSPDNEHFGDDGIDVIGIVVRAFQNHYEQRRRG